MPASDREEVFRSSNQALRETVENQLAAHRSINQRALDLVKIDLLAASIAVSAISLTDVQVVVPYLAASVVAFLYSVWESVRVFRPRHFTRGLGAVETGRIQQAADGGLTPDVHHEQLAMAYREAVVNNSNAYLAEAILFGNAVWASVAVVLFAAVAATVVRVPVSPVVTPLVCVVVLLVCLWGKDQYGFERKVSV